MTTQLTLLQDRPLKAWIPHQDEYLRECIRRDGREGRPDVCQRCQEGPGVIRCEDCFGGEILCEECTVSVHHRLPLHRIEVSSMLQPPDPNLPTPSAGNPNSILDAR